MARKPRKPTRKSNSDKSSKIVFPPRYRAPREERVVSTQAVRVKGKRKKVPQIRLTGAWLKRLGFDRGAPFLVLADVPNEILLVLAD